MQYWVDGISSDSIPLDDRGLNYGDGLFETIRLYRSRAPLLTLHLSRLSMSAKALEIQLDPDLLESQLKTIFSAKLPDHAVMKIILTRGSSQRGYALPSKGTAPRIIISVSEAAPPPDDIVHLQAQVSPVKLARQELLAGHKHLNRLENVLAASHVTAPDTAVLFDQSGLLIEAISSNLFLVVNNKLVTASLESCGVAGIARKLILEKLAAGIGVEAKVCDICYEDLQSATEVFCCNSIQGIQSVSKVDKKPFPETKLTRQLFNAWWKNFYALA